MPKKKETKKTVAHTRYRLKDKTIVPGVTTILSILAKPALIPWANKMGLRGIDVNKYVDDKADIGTLAHQMVTDYLSGQDTIIYADYSENQISAAENSFLSFLEWEKKHKIEKPAIFVEKPLVHEELRFGGTGDIYCVLDGKKSLIELKTGSGIYPEHVYQSATNKILLEYHGYPVEQVTIVNIPRTEDEGFSDKFCSRHELEIGFEIFELCLKIYQLRKEK